MQIRTLKTCNQAFTKIVIVVCLKLGKLIEDNVWIQ